MKVDKKRWWGSLKGMKGEKPWWRREYRYDPDWKQRVPGYEPGKPVIAGRFLDISSRDEMAVIWGRKWGAQGEIGKLRSVLISRPTENETSREKQEAPDLHFLYHSKDGSSQDLKKMQEQHDKFVSLLKDEVDEVIEWDAPQEMAGPYVRLMNMAAIRSPVVLNEGVILQRHSHTPAGRGKEVIWQHVLTELGIPILFSIHGKGSLQQANWIFLDSEHVCLGNSIASNSEGIQQVRPILEQIGVKEVHEVFLPGNMVNPVWPAYGIMHLDLALGMADLGLGIYYGLPTQTIEYLLRKGINLIEVPPEEQRNLATNIVALEPGKVVLAAGNPCTARALGREGVDVIEVELSEFGKSGVGPRCLTLPLIRDPDPSIKELEGRMGVAKLAN
jgi:N-dimethylarginine dimethylaminohydrolase